MIVTCPSCQKRFRLPDERHGIKFLCKNCRGVIDTNDPACASLEDAAPPRPAKPSSPPPKPEPSAPPKPASSASPSAQTERKAEAAKGPEEEKDSPLFELDTTSQEAFNAASVSSMAEMNLDYYSFDDSDADLSEFAQMAETLEKEEQSAPLLEPEAPPAPAPEAESASAEAPPAEAETAGESTPVPESAPSLEAEAEAGPPEEPGAPAAEPPPAAAGVELDLSAAEEEEEAEGEEEEAPDASAAAIFGESAAPAPEAEVPPAPAAEGEPEPASEGEPEEEPAEAPLLLSEHEDAPLPTAEPAPAEAEAAAEAPEAPMAPEAPVAPEAPEGAPLPAEEEDAAATGAELDLSAMAEPEAGDGEEADLLLEAEEAPPAEAEPQAESAVATAATDEEAEVILPAEEEVAAGESAGATPAAPAASVPDRSVKAYCTACYAHYRLPRSYMDRKNLRCALCEKPVAVIGTEGAYPAPPPPPAPAASAATPAAPAAPPSAQKAGSEAEAAVPAGPPAQTPPPAPVAPMAYAPPPPPPRLDGAMRGRISEEDLEARLRQLAADRLEALERERDDAQARAEALARALVEGRRDDRLAREIAGDLFRHVPPPGEAQPLNPTAVAGAIESPARRRLFLKLVGKEVGDLYFYALSQTWVDVGAWLMRSRAAVALVREMVIVFAPGRKDFVERHPIETLGSSIWNPITHELVLAPAEGKTQRTLKLHPAEGPRLVSLIHHFQGEQSTTLESN